MVEVDSLEQAIGFSRERGLGLLYISRPTCGVCTALKPKVEALSRDYPELRMRYVNLDDIPAAAGHFSVFTIPAILVYAEGKEAIREARYVSMDSLETAIARYYGMMFDE